MARVSFMKQFPDGMPTHFMEKILCRDTSMAAPGYEKYVSEFLMTRPIDVKIAPKLHTIRKSAHLQKYVGKDVECFYWKDKPYQSKHQVWGKVRIDGVQHIKIKWNDETGRENYPTIHIDGKAISTNDYLRLSVNDGFENFTKFAQWFKEDFTGYIYHFTKLRY